MSCFEWDQNWRVNLNIKQICKDWMTFFLMIGIRKGRIKRKQLERESMRRRMMLPLKLVRSLVLGESLKIKNPHEHDIKVSDDEDEDDDSRHFNGRTRSRSKNGALKSGKTPLLLFMPTNELVTDTYRLATLARDIGMDLYPNPSLSHLIFSWPSSSSSNTPSISSSSYSSLFWSLPNDAIPLPFPSLSISSISNLRCFVALSKGFFKLGFSKHIAKSGSPSGKIVLRNSNWDGRSVSLIFRVTGNPVVTMEGFCLALAGSGWSIYKSMTNSNDPGKKSVMYVFRKTDMNRVRVMQTTTNGGAKEEKNLPCGESRIRELKLPSMDFRNAPVRILQYILLMTDDLFYIA